MVYTNKNTNEFYNICSELILDSKEEHCSKYDKYCLFDLVFIRKAFLIISKFETLFAFKFFYRDSVVFEGSNAYTYLHFSE